MIGSLFYDNVGSRIEENEDVEEYFESDEPKARGRPVTVGRTQKLRLMYKGYKADQGAPFEYEGVSFQPRTVHSVTPDVFNVFKNFHNFIVVEGVKETVLHFPGSFT